MTLSSNLKLDVVTFATVAVPLTPTSTFSAINDASIRGGAQLFTESPAGHPAPLFGAIERIQPEISFTTPQIDTVVSALSTWGAGVSSKLYQKKSTGVAPSARSGTVHTRHDVAQAVAFWSQITLPANGRASAQVMVKPIWNGTDLPIVANGSVALLAGAMAETNYFAAGPVKINTVLVDGVESVTVSSGTNFRGEGDSSTVYDTYGELSVGQCIVTIKTKNKTNWSTVLLAGLAVTDLTFYAKAWANAQSTSFVADATASHILFNNTTCLAIPGETSASGQSLYSDTLSILCLAPDDTHSPLTMTPSSAIV